MRVCLYIRENFANNSFFGFSTYHRFRAVYKLDVLLLRYGLASMDNCRVRSRYSTSKHTYMCITNWPHSRSSAKENC